VPDAKSASVVIYVNLARLLSGDSLGAFGPGGDVDANVKAVSAIGMTATNESSSSATFRLKVITR
jgi:hypothetical protein